VLPNFGDALTTATGLGFALVVWVVGVLETVVSDTLGVVADDESAPADCVGASVEVPAVLLSVGTVTGWPDEPVPVVPPSPEVDEIALVKGVVEPPSDAPADVHAATVASVATSAAAIANGRRDRRAPPLTPRDSFTLRPPSCGVTTP